MKRIKDLICHPSVGVAALVLILMGCASNPDKLEVQYVSSLKYRDYDCDQLAFEMDQVGGRTTQLYKELKAERKVSVFKQMVQLSV